MGRKDSLPEDAPAPRLCELVKWPHFQGYGFNLHSEKGKDGQFIGKIDPQSPAEACGLREGDQIIEVNGVNTSNENHKQVVERIKTHSDHASLLVVDPKAAEYYKKRNIVVKGTMANVKQLKASSDGPTRDKETGESETSSQTHLSIEDSLTLAAQGDGGDEPPPVPPKTELASEEQKPTEPENAEVPPPVEGAPAAPEAKAEEPDAKPAVDKPAEEKPAEEKPAEVAEGEKPTEKAEEEKPAEKKSEEEKPEEKKPEEEKATNKTSEEETPTEKKPEEERAEEKAPEAPLSEGAPDAKPAEKEANSSKDASPAIDTSLQVESGSDRAQPSPAPSASSTGTVESAKSAESGSTAAEGDKFGLKLNMTAAEMREYLKGKKRHDPRNDNLSFKRRHEIVQNM